MDLYLTEEQVFAVNLLMRCGDDRKTSVGGLAPLMTYLEKGLFNEPHIASEDGKLLQEIHDFLNAIDEAGDRIVDRELPRHNAIQNNLDRGSEGPGVIASIGPSSFSASANSAAAEFNSTGFTEEAARSGVVGSIGKNTPSTDGSFYLAPFFKTLLELAKRDFAVDDRRELFPKALDDLLSELGWSTESLSLIVTEDSYDEAKWQEAADWLAEKIDEDPAPGAGEDEEPFPAP